LGTLLYYTDGDDVIEYNTVTGMDTGNVYDDCDMQNGAVSPDGSRLYCVDEGDEFFIYDIANPGPPLQVIDLGDADARGVAVSSDGARAFVPFGDVLKVVDTTTFDVTEIDLTCEDARDIVIVQEIPPPPPPVVEMVPTLSEWGLMAMAGILGIIGFMVMRRRKATA
jgi:DNA-binding beta-propeller fold protein YncE